MATADSLSNTGLASTLISFLLNAGFQLIWSALNILQIISFMSVCKMKLPANSSELFDKILGIVTFDVIPEAAYGPI